MSTNNGTVNSRRIQPQPKDLPIKSRSASPIPKRNVSWSKVLFYILVVTGLVAFVFVRRSAAQSNLVKLTQQMAVPTVLAVRPETEPSEVHLTLPGTVQAYTHAAIYSRVDGYVQNWLVDIGTHVKKGQLLAEIETPETDQQLRQTLATVVLARANVGLAQVTAKRYDDLASTDAVSKQEVDTANSDLEARQATLAADQATADRLEQIEGFKEIYAPFDGVITQRLVDIGYLINSGAGTKAQELFEMEQTNILRVYVQIPEAYSHLAVPGGKAEIQLASSPNQRVEGTLVRTAEAIDPTSQTILTEVDIPNADGKLYPGGYAQVYFDFKTGAPTLVVPGNSLIFRAQGPQLGLVDPKTNLVHLQDIKIGRDLGNRIEVEDGLKATDEVIVNPSDSLSEGAKVQTQLQQMATNQ
jgi:RND family efflux transporter MFP subunit